MPMHAAKQFGFEYARIVKAWMRQQNKYKQNIYFKERTTKLITAIASTSC